VKIAIDAMGGDHAPQVVVEGAALAVQRDVVSADRMLLVGPDSELRPAMDAAGLTGVEILHAPEVIEMDASPATAIRSNPNSSIVLGMKAVREGRAQGFVSAGNTGAVVAAAQLILGRLPGVSRPGIAVPVPTNDGHPCIVLDVGANIYCKPIHMLQYAVMAGEYSKANFGNKAPRIGLLNIGAEEGKGNPLILEAHDLLRDADLNYQGFVEGQDIMSGAVDVVVCEGFVGNVILKVAEGLGAFVSNQVQAAFSVAPPREEVKLAVAKAFQQLDYAEYGGAPLLGVSSPVLIGHGRSSPHAIMNMLKAALKTIEYDVTRKITDRLGSGNAENTVS
jgi:glycerol-3-phosphate acyltransferase PlsX